MSELKLFINSIKNIQNQNSNFLFNFYSTTYHKIFKQILKSSSISMNFRLVLKKDFLNKINISEFKKEIESPLNDYLNNKANYYSNKILKIETLETFLNTLLFKYSGIKDIDNSKDENKSSLDKIISVELLLVKRASGPNDRYSGNIAFPGGKYEKADKEDFHTAVRETQEEIGLTLLQDSPFASRYLGPNPRFDVTMDLKYIVTSHFFIIFDFFRESESTFVLSDKELSDVFYVPLEYFRSGNTTKIISQNIFGSKAHIKKLVLNNNEEFLIYGLTMRKIIRLIGRDNMKFKEQFVFVDYKLKNLSYNLFTKVYTFSTDPVYSYNLFKYLLLIYLFYYSISNLNKHFRWTKF